MPLAPRRAPKPQIMREIARRSFWNPCILGIPTGWGQLRVHLVLSLQSPSRAWAAWPLTQRSVHSSCSGSGPVVHPSSSSMPAILSRPNRAECDGGVKKPKPTTLHMPSQSSQSIKVIIKTRRTKRNSSNHTQLYRPSCIDQQIIIVIKGETSSVECCN